MSSMTASFIFLVTKCGGPRASLMLSFYVFFFYGNKKFDFGSNETVLGRAKHDTQ